jgi:hypothetical protein
VRSRQLSSKFDHRLRLISTLSTSAIASWSVASPAGGWEPSGDLRALILHHTHVESDDVRGGEVSREIAYMRLIEGLHLARGWDAIGYHFVVMPSGRRYPGRPVSAMGAHVLGHNRGTVGLALAGDFNVERPSRAALAAAARLRREITAGVHELPLLGHGDLAETSCPGDNLACHLPSLRGLARA